MNYNVDANDEKTHSTKPVSQFKVDLFAPQNSISLGASAKARYTITTLYLSQYMSAYLNSD